MPAAITANLAVVNQTKAGYVSLTPTPNASPTDLTINFPTGDVRANGLTIPVDRVDGDGRRGLQGAPGARSI